MSQININNSYSQLVAFPDTVHQAICKALTYKNEEVAKQKLNIMFTLRRARYMKRLGYVNALREQMKELGPEEVCLVDSNGSFPSGLLYLVEDTLKQQRFTSYQLKDLREKPEAHHSFLWKSKPPEPRYYQVEAIQACLKHHRGVLELVVGSGKTLIASYLIKELGLTTLFVVPSAALLQQAYDVFAEYFGSSKVQKLTSKDVKSSKKLKPIRVVTVQTLASLFKTRSLDRALDDVGLFIGDEIHHGGSESYTKLLPALNRIYYRFGLSGTYLRNDSKTFELWGVAGRKLYEYSASKATKEGFLTPVEFHIHKLGGRPDQNYQKEYPTNYSSLEFMKAILDTVRKIPKDKQILILVDRKEACGNLIHEFLKQHNIEASYVTGDNNSKEIKQGIEDFNNKKSRIFIGSQVLGEGCDIRSTDHLILGRGGKSEISIVQAIGRAVRLYPGKQKAYVHDFHFRFTKYLSKHLEQRCEIFEKQFAAEIVREK
jgi:superfamily II DNA or RNA helicase